jgi:hypothetical protein
MISNRKIEYNDFILFIDTALRNNISIENINGFYKMFGKYYIRFEEKIKMSAFDIDDIIHSLKDNGFYSIHILNKYFYNISSKYDEEENLLITCLKDGNAGTPDTNLIQCRR